MYNEEGKDSTPSLDQPLNHSAMIINQIDDHTLGCIHVWV